MHVEVVCQLDGTDELHQLLAKVVHACRRHHEVVLLGDGETLSDSVTCE
jgi:hypothetical protein